MVTGKCNVAWWLMGVGIAITFSSPLQAEFIAIGTGADGEIVINNRYEVDSVKTTLTQSASSGVTDISIGSSAGFKVGDEVLIIDMQGSSGAGNYEFNRVVSVRSNALQLTSGLQNSFDATSDKIAIQRIPNYTNVTVQAGGMITATPWNGATGGIVALRANGVVKILGGGSINANYLGFRGGQGIVTSAHAGGYQGESYLGTGAQANRNANGGGGGAGLYQQYHPGLSDFADWGNGGGGGSYGSLGVKGVEWGANGSGKPGDLYGAADLSRLLLGSGGGSGASDDDGSGTSSGGAGGRGGGILFLAAQSLLLSGSLTAAGQNGFNAINNSGEDESGGGGGGSGGSLFLALEGPLPTIDAATAVPFGAGGLAPSWCNTNGGHGGLGILYVTNVPEPGTLTLLLAFGALGLIGYAWRRHSTTWGL